jgi:hypothetical protein
LSHEPNAIAILSSLNEENFESVDKY